MFTCDHLASKDSNPPPPALVSQNSDPKKVMEATPCDPVIPRSRQPSSTPTSVSHLASKFAVLLRDIFFQPAPPHPPTHPPTHPTSLDWPLNLSQLIPNIPQSGGGTPNRGSLEAGCPFVSPLQRRPKAGSLFAQTIASGWRLDTSILYGFLKWVNDLGLSSFGCGSKPMVPFWGRCTTHFSLF